MKSNKKHYVAVLPDGTESNHEIQDDQYCSVSEYCYIAEQAIRQVGVTQPRTKDPYTIEVKIYTLNIENGQLKREYLRTVEMAPPLARMTDDDFERELAEALDGLPPEFASWVSGKAYEDGHYAGREEVVLLAGNMASDLKKAVDAYNLRLKIKQGVAYNQQKEKQCPKKRRSSRGTK